MKQSGFSLVELSIVLVILGLLTGGILGGQALMRAAELRSVTQDISKFQTAIHTFEDKYFALPGDMTNAVRFWGAAAGGTSDGQDATCIALDETSPSTGTETCNGDGNGWIGASSANRYERFRFWQHLANAGLLEGTFTGVHGAAGPQDADRGGNIPASKINNVGYHAQTFSSNAANANYYVNSGGTHLYIGADNGSDAGTWFPAIKPEDVYNIDVKMDDGRPSTGDVFTFISTSTLTPGCTDTDVASTANYSLQQTANLCAFVYRLRDL